MADGDKGWRLLREARRQAGKKGPAPCREGGTHSSSVPGVLWASSPVCGESAEGSGLGRTPQSLRSLGRSSLNSGLERDAREVCSGDAGSCSLRMSRLWALIQGPWGLVPCPQPPGNCREQEGRGHSPAFRKVEQDKLAGCAWPERPEWPGPRGGGWPWEGSAPC